MSRQQRHESGSGLASGRRRRISRKARPPFAITHAPGHMFITDARDQDYVI
jgi:hypothetical protein